MTDDLLRSYLAGSRTEVGKKTKANESWALSWRTSCRSLTRQEANAWPRPSFYVSSDPRLTILRVLGDTLMLILFTVHLSQHLLRPLIHLAWREHECTIVKLYTVLQDSDAYKIISFLVEFNSFQEKSRKLL